MPKPILKPKVCAVTGEPATHYVADPDCPAWTKERVWLGERAYAAMIRVTETRDLPGTRKEAL